MNQLRARCAPVATNGEPVHSDMQNLSKISFKAEILAQY